MTTKIIFTTRFIFNTLYKMNIFYNNVFFATVRYQVCLAGV